MKFLEIQLLAYGHFTNRVLRFPAGGPDFHIVYGGNEAGKSTMLRAISGFLYEIEVQTRDDFIHNKADLRIGARLQHSSGTDRMFIRKKGKPGATLLDISGHPIDEGELKAWLSVTDRDLFRQMFGLSHEQLRAAGHALANAEDDAGRMLFGAALNGTALQETLVKMEKEAKAEAAALRDSIKRFQEKRKAVAGASLPIKDWEALNADLERTRQDVKTLEEAVKESAAEKARILRLQRVLPMLVQRTSLAERRTSMGEVRLLSSSIGETRRALQQERDQAAIPEIERICARIRQRQAERDALSIPSELLAEAERLRVVADQLSHYRKERKDLPGVTRSIIDFENQERSILADLGLAAMPPEQRESLRIDAAARRRIQDLDRGRAECASGLRKLEGQIAAKRETLRQAEEQFATMPPVAETGVLENVWSRIEDRGIDEKVRRSAASLERLNAAVDEAQAATAPWIARADQVLTMPVPPEDALQRFVDEEKDDDRQRRHREEASADALAASQKAERGLGRLSGADAPTDEQLETARARRQRGWTHVLEAWEGGKPPEHPVEGYAPGPLATEYAQAVKCADDVADRLRHHADVSAKYDRLTEAKAEAEGHRRGALAAIAALDDRARRRAEEWTRLWAPTGTRPGGPRDMLPWRQRFDKLREAVRQRDEAARNHRDLELTLDEHQRAVAAALTAIDSPAPASSGWRSLAAYAEQVLDRARNQRAEIQRIEVQRTEAARELKRLEAEEKTDRKTIAELDDEWAGLVGRLRLRPQATGAEAAAVLEKIEELFNTTGMRQPQEARRRAIWKQQSKFEAETVDLVTRLGPELIPLDDPVATALRAWHAEGIPEPAKQRNDVEKDAIERLAQTLLSRHADAVRDSEAHGRLTRELDEAATELAQAEARLASVRQRTLALLAEAGCDSEPALVRAEVRSEEARQLDLELKQLEEKILIAGEGKTITELEQTAAQADPDHLAAAAEQAGVRHSQLENDYRAALTRLGEQQQRVREQGGRGDAAVLAGEAQQILAKARAHAARSARLETGKLVLERSIENYRRNNESAILRRAESLFRRLTLDRYCSLRVEYEGGKAKLRAIRAGEEVDVARALSDGTLDQLFLSLRLASIEQHLASQEPMPLVLDDIFINFDDGRTRAGLETLAEFAAKTQVLLLTHHARTIELAQSALPASAWLEHRLDTAPTASARM